MPSTKIYITFLPDGVKPESVGCGAVYNPLTQTLTFPPTATGSVVLSFVVATSEELACFEFGELSTHGRPGGGRG